jgi:hypothetical protein
MPPSRSRRAYPPMLLPDRDLPGTYFAGLHFPWSPAPAMSNLSRLDPTPHAITVYASLLATQHSLPSGRYSLKLHFGPRRAQYRTSRGGIRLSAPGLRLGKCTKDADHRYPPLLRARRKRPCCRCAAKQCNDVAPSHCLPVGSHPDHQLRSSKQEIASAEIGPMVNLQIVAGNPSDVVRLRGAPE